MSFPPHLVRVPESSTPINLFMAYKKHRYNYLPDDEREDLLRACCLELVCRHDAPPRWPRASKRNP